MSTPAVRMQVAQMDLRAAANNACRAATEAVRSGDRTSLVDANAAVRDALTELLIATSLVAAERKSA